MKLLKISLILSLLSFIVFACEQETEENTEETTENVEETTDSTTTEDAEVTEETTEAEVKSTRGQIITLGEVGEDETLTIQVDHEEIPDFMMAMRMDLKVAQADVAELKEGDKISFDMQKMEEGGFKMQNIEKLPEDTELTLKEIE